VVEIVARPDVPLGEARRVAAAPPPRAAPPRMAARDAAASAASSAPHSHPIHTAGGSRRAVVGGAAAAACAGAAGPGGCAAAARVAVPAAPAVPSTPLCMAVAAHATPDFDRWLREVHLRQPPPAAEGRVRRLACRGSARLAGSAVVVSLFEPSELPSLRQYYDEAANPRVDPTTLRR